MKFSTIALIASSILSLSVDAQPNNRFNRFRQKSSSKVASVTAAAVCSAGAATATETVFVTVSAGGNNNGGNGGIPAGIGGGNGGNGGGKGNNGNGNAAAQTTSKKATATKNVKPVVTTALTTVVRQAPATVTVTVTRRGGRVVTTQVATTIASVETQVLTVTVTEEAQASETSAAAVETSAAAAESSAAVTEDAAATATATSSAAEATATGGAGDTGDPQTTLTLDPSNVMKNLESDGNPGQGEIPSLTSSNNFINHCLIVNKPLTNGQQIKTGSCNTTPMGRLIAKDQLPSSTFQNPPNFGSIPANQPFQIEMRVRNMITGNFVNAAANYYIAPAQTRGGVLIAHTHVAIQKLDSFDQKNLLDPLTFTFFKGLNDPAVGDVVSTTVAGGLPAGFYRMASINSAANHQPVLSSVEEHGSLDAFSYFQAV